MDRKERGRAVGGSIGGFVIGYVGAALKDALGLPFLYACSLVTALCFAWGWWPEIDALPWLTRKVRIGGGVIIAILVLVGAWASFFFNPKVPLDPPKLRITDAGLIPLPNADDIRINVHYVNDGPRGVRAPLPLAGLAATKGGTLNKKQEDDLFRHLETTRPDPENTTELAQGATGFSTIPADINRPPDLTRERLDQFHREKAVLYVFASVAYFDGNTNDVWHTQWCQYLDLRLPDNILPREAPHLCLGHNGVVGPEKVK